MSSVRLWLRGRASVLISEGCWFDSPGVHVEVSLGKILNSKLLLMCWSAPCMTATTISVWIAVSRFGQKRDKCPIMNKYNFSDNYILIAVWWDSDNLWIDWFPSKTLPSLLGFLQLFFVCLFVLDSSQAANTVYVQQGWAIWPKSWISDFFTLNLIDDFNPFFFSFSRTSFKLQRNY